MAFNAKFEILNSYQGSNPDLFEVTGNVTDVTGTFSAANINIGDMIYVDSSLNYGYDTTVYEVITKNGENPDFSVNLTVKYISENEPLQPGIGATSIIGDPSYFDIIEIPDAIQQGFDQVAASKFRNVADKFAAGAINTVDQNFRATGPGGVVKLNGSGKIDPSILPENVGSAQVHSASSVGEMLSLQAKTGDYVKRSDNGTTFVLLGSNPSLLSSWNQLSGVTAGGTSTTVLTDSEPVIFPEALNFLGSGVSIINDEVNHRTNIIIQGGGDKVSVPYVGPWTINNQYNLDEVVLRNGAVYICRQSHTTSSLDNAPPTGMNWASFWQEFIPKGAKGANFVGPWETERQYILDDIVNFGQDTYIYVGTYPAKGEAPPSFPLKWKLFAKGGLTGPQGFQGFQGPRGFQGVDGIGSLTINGAWQATSTYSNTSLVTYDGSLWKSMGNNNLNHVPEYGPFWTEVVSKGLPGNDSTIPGPQGANGVSNVRFKDDVSGYDSVRGMNVSGYWNGSFGYVEGDMVLFSNPVTKGTDLFVCVDTPDNDSTYCLGRLPYFYYGYRNASGEYGVSSPYWVTFAKSPEKDFVWYGDWSSGDYYYANDVVRYLGAIWLCLDRAHDTIDRPDISGKWRVLVDKGDKGEAGESGEPGAQGPSGSDNLTSAGAWIPTGVYLVNDIVSYNGEVWLALATSIAGQPPTENETWTCWIKQGAQGIQGSQGNQGFQGDDGLDAPQYIGEWVNSTNYTVDSLVSDRGSLYICTNSNVNSQPNYINSDWQIIASKGDAGSNLTFSGDWYVDTQFQPNSVVTFQGELYANISTEVNVGNTPSDISSVWQKVVQRGTQGFQGYQGYQGFRGYPGVNLPYMGNWAAGNNYLETSLVTYNGDVWFATVTNIDSIPTQGNENWTLFNARGVQGNQGYQGVDGQRGPQGYTGERGIAGERGPQGQTGSSGPIGPQGSVGVTGLKGDPGFQGAAGSMLPYYGTWNSDQSYAVNDLVSFDGSTWVCLFSNSNSMPMVGNSAWLLFVSKGDKGVQGNQGVKGDDGSAGVQGAQGESGRDGINPAGIWSLGQNYGADDVVQYKGNAWICTSAHTSIEMTTPPEDELTVSTNWWALFVSKGYQGAPGIGLTFAGEWNASTQYSFQQLVSYNGSTWTPINSIATLGSIPSTVSTEWNEVISKGEQGVPGGGTWFRIEGSAPVGGTGPGYRTFTNLPANWEIGPANVTPFSSLGLGSAANDLIIYHKSGRYIGHVNLYDVILSGVSAGTTQLTGTSAFTGIKGNLANTAFRLAGFATTTNPVRIVVALAD